MPRQYVMYRDAYEKSGLIQLWNDQYIKMNKEDKAKILSLIKTLDYTKYNLGDFQMTKKTS